jgi:SAM-dependent methyltransferase
VKEPYLRYYLKHAYSAPFRFLADFFTEIEPRKRLSIWNRLSDYISILLNRDKNLLLFHREINQSLLNLSNKYPNYDYGEGYFYQSFALAHISGFRNTEERVNQLGLKELVKKKSVLDIGCNTGFLLLSLADSYDQGFGFDINPYVVEIANKTKSYLGIKNTTIITSSFESLKLQASSYDIILSLANHSTFDQNTKQDIGSYFEQITSALKDGGMLVFESHPPAYEDKTKLEKTINIIKKLLHIDEIKQLPLQGFLDKGRTYVLARKIGN